MNDSADDFIKAGLKPERTFQPTNPGLIDEIKEKNRKGIKLSMEEMIVWNAAKLNGYAFCTKHKRKYRFHDGCESCNNTCRWCDKVILGSAQYVHHFDCPDIPASIRKQNLKHLQKIRDLRKKLEAAKKLPDSNYKFDLIRNIEQRLSNNAI